MRLKSTPVFLLVFLGLFGLLIGGRYLGAFPTIPQPAPINPGDNGSISWDVKLNHPFVEKSSDGEILMNLKIKGREMKASKRAPVNLVLVIDRSGSMDESGKLEYAKEAAKRIISGLGSGDRIGIVAYATDVQLLYPIQFLTNKENAISVVDSLYATDSTNLSGGLTAGIDQLRSLERDGYVNRLILLSDGLANVGITQVGQLTPIASQAAEGGIHITTMGLGLNYDENLMMNLAEYGAGNYYFIESPSQLSSIFDKEFGQILATVAKGASVYLSLAPGVELKNVYGYTHSVEDGRIRINLGDIFGGMERNILIKLDAPTDKVGKLQLAMVSFEFTDIVKNNVAVSLQSELAYEVTEDKDKVAANEDKEVTARGVSVDAANDMYRSTTYYETGNRVDALYNIKAALGRISELNNSPHRSADTVKQEEELRKAADLMEAAPAVESDAGKSLIKDYKAKARELQK